MTTVAIHGRPTDAIRLARLMREWDTLKRERAGFHRDDRCPSLLLQRVNLALIETERLLKANPIRGHKWNSAS